jgi:hypothetical protein
MAHNVRTIPREASAGQAASFKRDYRQVGTAPLRFGPHSDQVTDQEWAHADASLELGKLRSTVTQFFDQILRTSPTKYAAHFAAVIESTWIVLVLVSSVPMTFTFCPANFSGVRWSLSV